MSDAAEVSTTLVTEDPIALIDRAHELLRTSSFDEIDRIVPRAVALVEGLDATDPLRIDVELEGRYLLAMVHIHAGRTREAAALLETPAPDGHVARRPRLPLMMLNALGRAYEQSSRIDEAVAIYERLRDDGASSGDSLAEAWGYCGLGRAYRATVRHREAIESLLAALDITRRTGNRPFEGTVLTNLALVYQELGDYARGLEHLLAAREIHETESPQSLGGTLINIGLIFDALKDYTQAVEYATKGLEVCERYGNRPFMANALVNIGASHMALGNHQEARDFLERGLAMQVEVGHREHAANAHEALGRLDRKLGRVDDARAHYDTAIELFTATKSQRGLASAMRSYGELLVELGETSAARELFERALAIASDGNLPVQSMRAHKALSGVWRRLGDPARALEHLEEYNRIRERWESEEAQSTLRRMQVLHEVESARKEAEIHRLRTVELASALEELKNAQMQLVHSEKMASLGQLTAGIAHEINNPVNFISASTAPLRRDLDEVRAIVSRALQSESDEVRERVERRMRDLEIDEIRAEIDSLLRGIEEGASRTAEIVRGLRSFSRLDEDELKAVDLHEGIDSTLTLLRPRLGAIGVVRHYGAIPPVECNPGQINQVLMNLLTNAAQAIEGEGTITVTTAVTGGEVTIAVEDTGAGIPAEVRARIFEPFFTTKEVGAGTGLGLSISYGIIERHGGEISVESEPGVGSRFTVRIPVAGTRR